MAKHKDPQDRNGELGPEAQGDPNPETQGPNTEATSAEELDAEFEAALAAVLALDPSERIDRYSQLADQIKDDLA